MSGKRRRALYAQCKKSIGGVPSRRLFWVNQRGIPVGDGDRNQIAAAGNVFRAFKRAQGRAFASPADKRGYANANAVACERWARMERKGTLPTRFGTGE